MKCIRFGTKKDGAKSIFPNVIIQRCIVRLIRNSVERLQIVYRKSEKDIQSAVAQLFDYGSAIHKVMQKYENLI